MISVVLSNYNGEKYLEETIKSVVTQDYKDYEFIIIDDGSTDKSKEIIKKYYKSYSNLIVPIYQEENKGQAIGFNIGVEKSKGDIICFLDSDDIWYSNKLKSINKFFNIGLKNIAFVQHNLNIIDKDKILYTKKHNVLRSGDYYKYTQKEKTLPGPFIPTSGLCFPKNVLVKVLPIPNVFKYCADGFLTRTTMCFGDIFFVSECWGAYRVHDYNGTFENLTYDSGNYINNILLPELNKFYEKNKINLRIYEHDKYQTLHKFLDFFPPFIPFIIISLIPPVIKKALLRLFVKDNKS